VTETVTHFVMKIYKDDDELFIAAEADHRLQVSP
jgi:hypothetical protein